MKTMKFGGLLFVLLLFSCSEKQPQTNKQQVQNNTIVNQEPVNIKHEKINSIESTKKMVKIEEGTYVPFIKDVGKPDSAVAVNSFYLDVTPVTNAEFLEFVKANPQWSKSKVLKIFADSTYLRNWPDDFKLPANIAPDAPVTNVSWYAAKAYAESVGKRLPTIL